ADAGRPEVEPERLAVVVASGIGGVTTLLAQHDVLKERGPGRVSPHLVPMLMPNGAAAIVELEFAARAGAHAPVSACASGAEANGAGAARALGAALWEAGVDPTEVRHVNAHATSTPLGDVAEARALRTALGSAVDDVVVSATKGSTGHLLGAAGAVEAIATVL